MLTRAQVEHICKHGVEDGHYFTRVGAAKSILAHDAALRFALEEVQATNRGIEAVRDEYYAQYIEATESEDRLRAEVARLKNICEEVAEEVIDYLNTSTRGGAGGLIPEEPNLVIAVERMKQDHRRQLAALKGQR